MNLLTFDSSELDSEGQLTVSGGRAEHLLHVLGVQPGWRLRVADLAGLIGEAAVVAAGPQEVVLRIERLEPPEKLPDVTVIVALPRPQIFKRVLQLCATMGVSRIMAIRSERVEKSYFSSPLLEEAELRMQLRLGLEQGVGAVLPQVSVHQRFRRFIEDELAVAAGSWLLLAHPDAQQSLAEASAARRPLMDAPVALAVGPERGWNEFELEAFSARGFQQFASGRRVLRVDQAVCMLLGQIQLLRELSGAPNACAPEVPDVSRQ